MSTASDQGERVSLTPDAISPRAMFHTDDGATHVTVHRAPRLITRPQPCTVAMPAAAAPPESVRIPWAMALLPLAIAVPMALLLHRVELLAFALLSPIASLGQYLVDRRSRRIRTATSQHTHGVALAQSQRRLQAAVAEHTAALLNILPGPPGLASIAGADIPAERRTEPGARLWERRRADQDYWVARVGIATDVIPVAYQHPGGTAQPVSAPVPLRVDLLADGPLGICGPHTRRVALASWILAQLAVYCAPGEIGFAADPRQWPWLRRLPHEVADNAGADDECRMRGASVDSVLLAGNDGPWGELHLAARPQALPGRCRTVIDLGVTTGDTLDAGTGAVLRRHEHPEIPFAPDLPTPAWTSAVATALAQLRPAPADDDPHGAIGNRHSRVSVTELVPANPADIAARWIDTAEFGDSLSVPLGYSRGRLWHLDLASAGPHGLIAGTTGSGKSVLLSSWMLLLAASYPPDRLAMLLIDYKGGAAFGDLAVLPHVVGVLTDLDGRASRRALDSLTAELRRRERRSAEGCPPTGRLLIVVDEFRVLAEEQPDLLHGLVRVATVGRSLGVHLVLATQRPAGVVSPEIRANAALRIALRLREVSDSLDVLNVPDAARLPADRPGLALAEVGGRVTPVQIAHADTAQRTAMITATVAAARLLGRRPAEPVWCPELPEELSWGQLRATGLTKEDDPNGPASAFFGLADLPSEQSQRPFSWPLDAHLAVIGGPGSGRSTMLRAIAAGCAQCPDVEVHLLDMNGSISSDLAQPNDRASYLGTTVHDDLELARALLARLSATGSADAARVRVLLIDDWDTLVARWGQIDNGSLIDAVLALARDGTRSGVRLAIAGGRSLATSQVTSILGYRAVLRLSDRNEALLLGLRESQVPNPWPPGRALWSPRGSAPISIQVAHTQRLPRQSVPHREPWRPLRLIPPPTVIAPHALPAGLTISGDLALGLGGDHAEPLGLPMTGPRGALICGGPGSGRSAALRLIGHRLAAIGQPSLLLDPRERPDVADVRQRLLRSPSAVLLVDHGWTADPTMDALVSEQLVSTDAAHGGHGGLAVVAVATAQDLMLPGRGALARLHTERLMVVIGPRTRSEVTAYGVPAAGADPFATPGRGVLINGSAVHAVQLAHITEHGSILNGSILTRC